MDKKLLKLLVDYSYQGNELNPEKVNKVEKLLKSKRRYLKDYIKALKKKEVSLSLFIDIPTDNFKQYKDEFRKIFPNKKIIWNIDPSLILGIRITDGDNVLEMSLKKSLEEILERIQQNYD